jgi:tRNA(Ile)-lysidine synthase
MAIARVEAPVVERAVEAALAECPRAVLAVSGGMDSMVLLSAAARVHRKTRSKLFVATFDHGTGKAAGRAAAMVSRECARLGIPCVSGRAETAGTREDEWRRARWTFLHAVAADRSASVLTAHTLDDQIETVFMRILRDAGPRGLAGLYAESEIVRPLLSLRRAAIADYAGANRVKFREDPTNADRRHLRNRVRLDLLPSIMRRNPTFAEDLLSLARTSAEWRNSLEELAVTVDPTPAVNGALRIGRASLSGFDADSLRVLWPALAARARVVMDRRGTHRAAEFTMNGATGGTIQLSGGVEIVMQRDHMLLRRWRLPIGASTS